MEKTVSPDAAQKLRAAKRIVVKVGSAILCADDGAVRTSWLASLAEDIAALRGDGCEVVVVTSGAIALGRKRLGLERVLRLDEKQAASAAGQAALAQAWQRAFDPHDTHIAQLLLTLDDTENRRRYLNARATFRTLLDFKALPMVNENDTVATSEIRYGDNDRLAAHAAQIVESDVLVILSDVDGLYTADPRKDPDATHIPIVEAITAEIEQSAAGPNKALGIGSGGMASKVAAAKIAGANGCATIIAAGGLVNPIAAIRDGAAATLLRATGNPARARRQWIGGRIKPAGSITIDAGAAAALARGASLLPAGVIAVAGDFSRGDAVTIIAPDDKVLGQGLSAYFSYEIKKIAGRRSEELEQILGYRRRPAVVEKNDLVLRTE
jgi:glutamate 5-kinase